MSDDALTGALQRLGVSRVGDSSQLARDLNRHVLSFTFPERRLPIDRHQSLELTPPTDIQFRKAPPEKPWEITICERDFSIAVQVRPDHTVPSQITSQAMALVAAIEGVRSVSGLTRAGVIRVFDSRVQEARYRVQLVTRWYGASSWFPPETFELSPQEWQELMRLATSRPWVALLQDLVDRTSAKAFYHVRMQLYNHWPVGTMQQEELGWSATWNSTTSRPVHYLLRLRLFSSDPTPVLYTGCEWATFDLPCDHGFTIELSVLEHGGIADLENAKCETCSTRILQAEDDFHLAAASERRLYDRFVYRQRTWTGSLTDDRNYVRTYHFHYATIFRIIGAALESLRAPVSLSPGQISPASFAETGLVLDHFDSVYRGYDKHWTCTSDDLHAELMREAEGVRINNKPIGELTNPPGWDDFLFMWLRRATSFMALRRCPGCGKDGLHWHTNDGLWYDPAGWEAAEGCVNGRSQARVVDITAMLDDIQL